MLNALNEIVGVQTPSFSYHVVPHLPQKLADSHKNNIFFAAKYTNHTPPYLLKSSSMSMFHVSHKFQIKNQAVLMIFGQSSSRY